MSRVELAVSFYTYLQSDAIRLKLREEALFGRLPLLFKERTLSPMGSFSACLHTALIGWCFLVGGYTANVMPVISGSIALMCGSLAGVTLVTLILLACQRYGCDFTDIAKPTLGQRGSKVALMLHMISQICWCGILMSMLGRSVCTMLNLLDVPCGPLLTSVATALGIISVWALTFFRRNIIVLLTTACLPGLLTIAILLLYVIFREINLADLIRIPPLVDVIHPKRSAIAALSYGLGAGLCWWPMLGASMRHCRTARAAVYPQILIMGLYSGAMSCLGLWAALLFRSFDPNQWLSHMGGKLFGCLTLICFGSGHIAACAASIVGIMHQLRHIRLLRQWSATPVKLLPFFPLMMFSWMPDFFYEHGAILLVLASYVLTPLACVLALDYLVLRHQRINVSQVFDDSPHAIYWYWGGYNYAAMMCVAVGMAVSLLGYNPITQVAQPWMLQSGSLPMGALIAAGLYACCARGYLIRRGIGGYRSPVAAQTILHDNL